MSEILTSAQMRAVEEAAIASGEVTGLELMERAGRGVVEAIFEEWPELSRSPIGPRAVILCGPGNNGGDGFVVARLLRKRGWNIRLFFWGDPEKLPPDARICHDLWARTGFIDDWKPKYIIPGMYRHMNEPGPKPIIVDAIFGIGANRALPAEVAEVTMATETPDDALPPRVVAIDIPSGICADTGANLGGAAEASLTVTFHAPKPGHMRGEGRQRRGKLVVKSIGL